MNTRTIVMILSAVLIASVLSGCVQEISEIETPDASPPTTAPEMTSPSMPAPPSIANWKYVSYRNLSISNAPALNQTARITYSIIPDRDIEVLLVGVSFLDGFEIVDVGGERLLTWGNGKMPVGNLDRCVRWHPTNLSKGEMYQFNFTIKAVKTGNLTITGLDWEDEVYLSVYEDSACIRGEPFPSPLRGRSINKSEFERACANMPADVRPTFPGDGYCIAPSEPPQFHYDWNGTEWVERKNQS